ncbi:Spermidine/putrescine-binding periplasmic protein 1 [Fagus crenata]
MGRLKLFGMLVGGLNWIPSALIEDEMSNKNMREENMVMAIPATSRFETNRIGGRVRGPSPLIHQWIEFCLQAARALPFKQEVIPGASPSALESAQVEVPTELTKGKPRLDTNLIAGVPPPEILARCEFLEPLSDCTLSDYRNLAKG